MTKTNFPRHADQSFGDASDFAAPIDWAAMYRSTGWQVVPGAQPALGTAWKRPLLSTWREFEHALVTDGVFTSLFGTAPTMQMGVICGLASCNLMVVDLDTHKHPEALDWWLGLMAVHNNDLSLETWTQTTGGGGKQLFFRCPDGFTPPTNKTKIGVDIRGQGGFAMLPPSRHESGRNYAWDDGLAPWDCDIVDAPDWLLEAITDLVGIAKAPTGDGAPLPRTDYTGPALTPFGRRLDGREEYMRDLIYGRLVDIKAEGREPTDDDRSFCFSQYLEGVAPRNGRTLDQDGRGIAAFISKWAATYRAQWGGKIAASANYNLAKSQAEVFTNESHPLPAHDPETGEIISPIVEFDAQPFDWIEPSSIERRQWLYGRYYIRKNASVTIAPGGVGKSSITMVEALAMATGKPLLDVGVKHPMNVWLFNGEDPLDELQRRMMAAMITHDINPEDFAGRLFVNSGRDHKVVVARADKNGNVIISPIVEHVKAIIKAKQIDVMIVDPFVSTHEVNENSNQEMQRVAEQWVAIAGECNCAIMLVHHSRKTSGSETAVEDGRGASAILNAVRVGRALNKISKEDAEKHGIDPARNIVRIDMGKSNLAPLGEASMFEMISQDLGNRSLSEEGDQVGVAVAYHLPALFELVTRAQCDEALKAIHDAKARHGNGLKLEAEGNCVAIIMDALGVPAGKAKAMRDAWINSGELIEITDGVKRDGRPNRIVQWRQMTPQKGE